MVCVCVNVSVFGVCMNSMYLCVCDCAACSIWSAGDHLYDAFPQHWTGTIVALSGMVLIDKQPYR